MTARFLEIVKEHQARAAEMVVHDVLKHGPYWAGVNANHHSVKNRYNDVLISNVSQAQAEELARLLNDMETA